MTRRSPTSTPRKHWRVIAAELSEVRSFREQIPPAPQPARPRRPGEEHTSLGENARRDNPRQIPDRQSAFGQEGQSKNAYDTPVSLGSIRKVCIRVTPEARSSSAASFLQEMSQGK